VELSKREVTVLLEYGGRRGESPLTRETAPTTGASSDHGGPVARGME